jgi:hypothetical protein
MKTLNSKDIRYWISSLAIILGTTSTPAGEIIQKNLWIFHKWAYLCTLKKTGYPVTILKKSDDLVAQLVEHIPFKDGVLGSSPSQVTFSRSWCRLGSSAGRAHPF